MHSYAQSETGPTDGVYNASTFAGVDIGAKVNAAIKTATVSHSGGTILIPDGSYSFSTTIAPVLTSYVGLNIMCSSPATVLNYTGARDAIYVYGTVGQFATLTIENCTLHGGSAGVTANGLHNQKTGGGIFKNLTISGFKGSGVYNQGAVNPQFIGVNLISNGVNLTDGPDTASSVSTNGLLFTGGSLQYGITTNYWEKASAGLVRDQLNSLQTIFEMTARVPNIIVESCDSCSVTNSYIEYFGAGNGSLIPNVMLGNQVGSLLGSNTAQTLKGFNLTNNLFLSPLGTSSISIFNGSGVNIIGNNEQGSDTYFLSFAATPSLGISFTTVLGNVVNWQRAAIQNYVSAYFNINDIVGYNFRSSMTVGNFMASGSAQFGFVSASSIQILNGSTAPFRRGITYQNDPQGDMTFWTNSDQVSPGWYWRNGNGGSLAAFLSPGGTLSLPSLTVNKSVPAGSGLQHIRVPIGCAAATLCSTLVSWSRAFADTNYTSTCAVNVGGGGINYNVTVWIAGKNAENISPQVYVNGSMALPAGSMLNCIGMHD